MRIATPSTLWETSSKSESIIIQHKIHFRIVNTLATAIATDLASPNHWQEVTSYISELPSIKTGIDPPPLLPSCSGVVTLTVSCPLTIIGTSVPDEAFIKAVPP